MINHSQMFDKMDDYFKQKSTQQQNLVEESNIYPQPFSPLKDVKTSSNAFKTMHEEKRRGPKCLIKTRWDVFEPRAFCKLSDKHKDEHFLQLFDDYLSTKMKLNDEVERNKKLTSKNSYLESEIAEVKKKSPDGKFEMRKKKIDDQNENQQLKDQVKRLHQKIIALTGNKHKMVNTRPQSAKQKAIIPTTENVKAELEMERKQVRELLLIIDQLKSTKFSLEAQLKEKQASNASSRVPKSGQPQLVHGNQSFQGYAFELERWKQKYLDLQGHFDKMSQEKDKRIKQLEVENIDLKQSERAKRSALDINKLSQINSNVLEEKILSLEREKDVLERELRLLVALPFNQSSNNRNQLELQEKCSKLELAVQKYKDQLAKTKEASSKYLAQLEYKSREAAMFKTDNEKLKKQVKELIQKQTGRTSSSLEIDYNDYYRKLMGIVKLEGNDPVWKKFASLSTPAFESMSQPQLKAQAEQLWKDKLQLLAHLERAQIQLKTGRQSTESRVGLYLKDKEMLEEELRVARARLDEWASMDRVSARKQVQIYESFGIRYDDTISVFDAEEAQLKQLKTDQNYFDMYLGQLNLDQTAILRNPNNKIKQASQMVSFLTVDFYNHDTQHSHFVQGNSRKLDNNLSYRVDINPALVKFLAKGSVSLQLWSPQGSSTILLGKGEVWLRDIVQNSARDVSAVIKGKCPFYQSDKSLIATVQYRIRMRLPIGSYCEWAREDSKSKGPADLMRLSQRKRLEIKVTRAMNLSPNSSTFVYFSLQGQDFFTQAVRGSSPEWNYQRELQLMMGPELQQELKQNYFQFTIFDDDKPVNEDVVGIAKADLTKLIDSTQKLNLDLDIKDTQFQIVGKLRVQFTWL